MDVRKIKKINDLIKKRHGNAKQIAERIEISERTVYKYIAYMKDELKAPIIFNSFKNRYEFESNGEIDIKWKEE
ncbi:MAG: HTH domain-containing protein [Bacteroidetes bacterium]|nr:HTH domain-containing protein [Bacteroidota bacterium]